jgi:phosphoribosyl 1,2-cyclic phosphodiesterase
MQKCPEEALKISLLASGSKGNAVYVESGETRLLLDAGLSGVEIIKRLAMIGVDAGTLHAILISHDHSDHTRGAGTLARKLKIPLLASCPTRQACDSLLKKTETIEFESGHSFEYRDLMIDPFPITHDAIDPVGFAITGSEGKIGFATDLGIVTRLVANKLEGCRLLVLEANHDEEMLMNGPYPWHLKQRIKSKHGHISNTESIELLEDLLHKDLEGVLLAHLSEVNNSPDIPRAAATVLLQNQTICSPALVIGDQYHPSTMLTI